MDIIILVFDILLLVVIFILKSFILRWLSEKKNWEGGLNTSIKINVYWLLILIGISIFFVILLPVFISVFAIDYYNDFIVFTTVRLLFFGINLLVGYLLINHFYQGSNFDSFVISLIIVLTEKAYLLIIQSVTLIIFGFLITDGIYIFPPY